MKKSIRRQISVLFIGLVGAILLISILINRFFLESFYVRDKKEALVSVYQEINRAAKQGKLTSETLAEKLTRQVEVDNITFVVISNENQRVLTASQNEIQAQQLMAQLMGYLLNRHEASGKLLEKTEKYEIFSAKNVLGHGEYVEMWGYLDNGNAFILRSPLDSIRESAGLSNRFLIYIMLIMAVVGSIVIWYFTKRITDPIGELANLSKRMAELDFEAKYEGSSEDEIGILGENFNAMSEKLKDTISELKKAYYELQKDIEKKEKMETMRTEFIGNVSHELKTPIALIQGYAEGLKEGVTEDPESRAFYCDVIIDEANKMNQLVKNLLTLNQLEVGEEEVAFERFNVVELIEGLIQNNEILIKQSGVKLQFRRPEQPVYVWADELKVEQVLRNYLSNALHYADGEKLVDVTLDILSEEEADNVEIQGTEKPDREHKKLSGDRVRITVFNTGTQIPEEDLDQIWNKFYKVDKARTREYGGHGIGLSIVKAIMESFHREYGVKNYENGVAFWFDLDLK